jgi:hypothetical protein
VVKTIIGLGYAEYSYWWQVKYGESGQSGWMVEVEMNNVFLKANQ